MQFNNMWTGLVAALAIAPAAASTLESRDWPSSVTQRFYLQGNGTGTNIIDGVYVGTQPQQGTYIGFDLPYGQVTTDFGYDPKSGLVYSACTGTGKPLVLAAFPNGGTAAPVKPALVGQKNTYPLQCTVLAKTLLCGVSINKVHYNKLVVNDYNKDGKFEVAISSVFGFAVQLVTETSDN